MNPASWFAQVIPSFRRDHYAGRFHGCYYAPRCPVCLAVTILRVSWLRFLRMDAHRRLRARPEGVI